MATLGFDESFLAQERALGLQGDDARNDPMGLQSLLPAGSREYHAAQTLPSGTTRKWFNGYEVVKIPAPPRLPKSAPAELVDVASLPDWARAAFPGTKRLNRIQSAIFQTAFYTAENMLICAPTGAGKTNCAMLALLHLVGQSVDVYGVLQPSALKVIIVVECVSIFRQSRL